MKNFLLFSLVVLYSFKFINAQNVGIGQASPTKKLEVRSTSGGDGLVLDMPNPSLFLLDNTSANKAWSIYNQGTDNGLSFRSSSDDFTTNLNTRLFLEHATGNVGIGTTIPDERLNVSGNSRISGQLFIGDAFTTKNVGAIQIKREGVNNGLVFWTETGATTKRIWIDDATETMQLTHGASPGLGLVIDNTGSVGIGTVSPTFRLDVSGTGRFTGQVTVPLTPTADPHAASKKYVDDRVASVTEVDPTWSGSANTTASVGRTGNVGVGTTSPASKFHVLATDGKAIFEDGIGGQAYIELDFSTAGSPQISMSDKNNDNFWTIGADDADNTLKFAGRTTGPSPIINANTTSDVKMTIQPSGNVGIGTTSPSAILDLLGAVQYPVEINRSGNVGDVGIEFHDNDANAQTGYLTFDHRDGNSNSNGASFHFNTTETALGVIVDTEGGFFAGTNLSLRSNGTSYLNGGNVGIGNASPDRDLVIGSSSTTTNKYAKIISREDAALEIIADDDNSGEDDNAYIYIAQDGALVDGVLGFTGANDIDPRGNAYAGAINNALLLGTLQSHHFQLGANGTAQLTIEPGGDIGIGLTNPSYKLHVNGKIRTNGINETSDGRLKKNVKSVENALDKVLALNGVTYEWRINEFPDKEFKEGVELGVIAQEIEKILPEVVDTDKEGYKSVQYSHIVPVLIEAIKEQQRIIASKDCELQVVKSDMSLLKAEVAEIKELLEMSANK